MQEFYLIYPQATTNLIANPSFELDTTGYTAVGSNTAFVRVANGNAFRGAWSLYVVDTEEANAGVYYGTVPAQNSYSYSFSIYFRGTTVNVGDEYKIWVANTSGTQIGSAVKTFVSTEKYQRVVLNYTDFSTTGNRRLYCTRVDAASFDDEFYTDCWQFEQTDVETTYCDGDQDGCIWTAGPKGAHKSRSQRSSQSRSGGRKVYFQNYGAYLMSQQATGMPPMKQLSTPFAIGHGSYYQGQYAEERTMTITFSVAGDGMENFHWRRQQLIDAMKPDLVSPQQPFIIGYQDGGEDVEISCRYGSGYELADGKVDIESLPIEIIAADPFWRRTNDNAKRIDYPLQTLADSYLYRQSNTGEWTTGNVSGGKIWVAKIGPDGYWYLGGEFTSCAGVSETAYFARYDPILNVYISLGNLNGKVRDLTFDNEGNVLIGGDFTTINAVSNAYLAKYVVLEGGWHTLGAASPNAYVSAVVVCANNQHYIFGNFTQVGATTRTRSARFTPTAGTVGDYLGSWGSVYSFDGVVEQAIVLPGIRESIYVRGTFDVITQLAFGSATVSTDGFAKLYYDFTGLGYTQKAAAIEKPSDATTDAPTSIGFSPDFSTLYAVFKTTTTAPAGSPAVDYIVSANYGSGWVLLGEADNVIDFMDIDPNTGDIYIGSKTTGSPVQGFSRIDGQFLYKSAVYTGNRWVKGTGFDGQSSWSHVAFDPNGNKWFFSDSAPSNFGSTMYTGVTATFTNLGTAEVYPTIVITGYGYVQIIRNRTTGAVLYGNFDTLLYANEKIIIDCKTGEVVSTVRGDFNAVLVPNSDLGAFTLIPGDNILEVCYLFDLGGPEEAGGDFWMYWRETHWSIDSSSSEL